MRSTHMISINCLKRSPNRIRNHTNRYRVLDRISLLHASQDKNNNKSNCDQHFVVIPVSLNSRGPYISHSDQINLLNNQTDLEKALTQTYLFLE